MAFTHLSQMGGSKRMMNNKQLATRITKRIRNAKQRVTHSGPETVAKFQIDETLINLTI